MNFRRVVANEEIETTVGNHRANRLDAGTTVLADSGRIANPKAKLVEDALSCHGPVRCVSSKFTAAFHGWIFMS